MNTNNPIRDIRNNFVEKMTETAMTEIFGKGYDNNTNNDEVNNLLTYFKNVFENAPINIETYLNLLVKKYGSIRINRTLNIGTHKVFCTSLEVDDEYGAYLRFAKCEQPFQDEFVYVSHEMTRDQIENLYHYVCGNLDNNPKMPYINAIKLALSDNKDFDFDTDTTLILQFCGFPMMHELFTIYVNSDDVICLTTRVNDETECDPLMDFSLDEIKAIYDVFVQQRFAEVKN